MDALPYVDTLFKEYLLFRGFTASLQAFNNDLAIDKGCGFQPGQICDLLFRNLIPQHNAAELVALLDFLNTRIYRRLDSSYEATVRKLEVSLLRLYIIQASKAGRIDAVKDFLAQHGESLLQGPDAAEWHVWFALPYLKAPASDPRFQVFFSKEWVGLVEASLRNFLAEVVQHLPLPAVLRFNADRLTRLSLGRQVESLTAQKAALQQQLDAVTDALQRQQHQGMATTAGGDTVTMLANGQRPLNLTSHLKMDYMEDGLSHRPSAVRDISSAQQRKSGSSGSYQALSSKSTMGGGLQASFSTVSNTREPSLVDSLPSQSSSMHLPPASGQEQQAQQAQQAQRQTGAPLEHALYSTSLSDAGSESNLEATPVLARSLTNESQSVLSVLSEVSDGSLTPIHSGLSGRADDDSAPTGMSTQAATPYASRGRLHFPDELQPPERVRSASQLVQSAIESRLEPDGPRPPPQQPAQQPETGQVADAAAIASTAGARTVQGGAAMAGSLDAEHEGLEAHEAAITCCCFAPGGRNVASASADGVVRISAPESLNGDASRAAVLLCGGSVTALAWDSRADKVLLVGTRGNGIKAWHVDTKRMVSNVKLDPPYPDVLDIACSPVEPTFAVSAGEAATAAMVGGRAQGKLSLWNMRAFKRTHSFAIAGDPALASICFSPDGMLLATGGTDGSIRIFDVATRSQVLSLSIGAKSACLRFLGDSHALLSLSAASVLQCWSLTPGRSEPMQTWDVSGLVKAGARAKAAEPAAGPQFAVAPHGHAIAFTSASGDVPVMRLTALSEARADQVPGQASGGQTPGFSVKPGRESVASQQLHSVGVHTGPVTALDWHPTANVLVSGSASHAVCITTLSM